MKIMVIADQWELLCKGGLIDEILRLGYEVLCVLPDSESYADDKCKGKKNNLKFYFIPKKKGMFLTIFIRIIIHCLMVYKVFKPEKILYYLTQGSLTTGFVFRFFKGTPVSVITGRLKFLKGSKGFWYSKICKYILSYAKNVFFTYKDDYDNIDRYKLRCKDKSILLRSWGVDMELFSKYPLPKTDLVYMSMPVLCCCGVKCFIETAKIVREKYPKVRFLLSGQFIPDPSVLSEQELDEACENKHIYYIESVEDIRPYLQVCSIFVQPGMKAYDGHIIEAEAAGRPILASDNPVNRSLVIEGYNGFLLPIYEASIWAEKIILLLENKRLKSNMADYSYELCSRWHDRRKINRLIIEKLDKKLWF